jgi:hypothetical protein
MFVDFPDCSLLSRSFAKMSTNNVKLIGNTKQTIKTYILTIIGGFLIVI